MVVFNGLKNDVFAETFIVTPQLRETVSKFLRGKIVNMRRKILSDDDKFINDMLKQSDKFSSDFVIEFKKGSLVFTSRNGYSLIPTLRNGSLRCYPITGIEDELKKLIF